MIEVMNKPIKIKRFLNYNKFDVFVSQLAHDYERLGYQKFMDEEYDCKGIYKRYLLGYKEYLTNQETGSPCILREYTGKFVLEPWIHADYFKFKNKNILNEIRDEIVPELYNHGFIFTSVQVAVQFFVRGDKDYERGF